VEGHETSMVLELAAKLRDMCQEAEDLAKRADDPVLISYFAGRESAFEYCRLAVQYLAR